jgi:hypothetical protein
MDKTMLLGLEVDTPPKDWVAIKAVLSLVCLDADGNVDTWHTMTKGTHNFEAMGLMSEYHAILQDEAPYIHFEPEWGDE